MALVHFNNKIYFSFLRSFERVIGKDNFDLISKNENSSEDLIPYKKNFSFFSRAGRVLSFILFALLFILDLIFHLKEGQKENY